jgi:hypothetical protein
MSETKIKKLPKWKTDPLWALRRAKRRKERLPIEAEQLLKGRPDDCLSYARDVLNSRLPEYLEDSVLDHFETNLAAVPSDPSGTSPNLYEKKRATIQKKASNWILNYSQVGHEAGEGEISEKVMRLFLKYASQNMESMYDWGQPSSLRLAKNLGHNIHQELESLLWSIPTTAIAYYRQSGKRIPEEFERLTLLEVDEQEFVEYVLAIFKGRAPENLEIILLEKPVTACRYAEIVLGSKLPEDIHSSLIMRTFGDMEEDESEAITSYLNFVKKTRYFTKKVLEEFDKTTTVEQVLKILGSSDFELK